MNATLQIWPMDELRNRLMDAGDEVESVRITSGHNAGRTRGSVLIMEIRKTGQGSWPSNKLDILERHTGQYTATLYPNKETLFLDSNARDQQINYGYSYPMNGVPFANPAYDIPNEHSGKSTLQLVEKIVALEKKIATLQEENKYLKLELSGFKNSGGKFAYAIEQLLDNWLLPKMGFTENQTTPMQGNQSNPNTMEWTQQAINDQDGDGGVNDAAEVLLMAFGPENFVRIAKRLQQQPTLVQTLTNML